MTRYSNEALTSERIDVSWSDHIAKTVVKENMYLIPEHDASKAHILIHTMDMSPC